jgi:hypothetical protein
MAALAATATALAQPEPEGVTDEELKTLAWKIYVDAQDGDHRGAIALSVCRAAIAADRARYARPTIEPVPVAERPEPEGVGDEELLCIDDLRNAWNAQADAANSWDELGIDEIVWFAQQQAITRYAHPTTKPVPVAERLPGAEDCDEYGFCWFWNLQWERWRAGWQDDECTHWLPHHALPTPTP